MFSRNRNTCQGIQVTTVRIFFQLLRIKQWVKNIFVVLPILFSGVLWTGDSDAAIRLTVAAFACFCAWSSAIYILNDVCDIKRDRQHPRKKNRPIASGRISIPFAVSVGLVLAVVPFCVSALPRNFFLAGGLFLANNVVYSLKLRSIAIWDVFSIAIGFVLRILGGCFALSVEPSQWILVCGFSLALLLGFGKRRMEFAVCGEVAKTRPVLNSYSVEFLNILLGITAAISLLSYLLYTIAPETAQLHGTTRLIYATPFVFYGVFRYAWLSLQNRYDGPDDVFYRDKPFFINGVLWMAAVLGILFFNI